MLRIFPRDALSLVLLLGHSTITLHGQASPESQETAQAQSAAKTADKNGATAPQRPVYTSAESAIIAKIKTLRETPDAQRGSRTNGIALEIAALPAAPNKLRLAAGLANLATEGDFGHEMLQSVANTLTMALTENPVPNKAEESRPAQPYIELAKLVRYEHVITALQSPEYDRAQAILLADEAEVEKADFTLSDLNGKSWQLSALRGKVVMVNFWATWCPPCRKEMPDLNMLAHRFATEGLIVLSLSDEDRPKVASYVTSHELTYPILLDTDGKTAKKFHVEGIPKTFIFDTKGKLAAQSIDMRTRGQFLQLLALAGIQ